MSDEMIRRKDVIKITWQEPSYYDPLNVLTEVRERVKALPTVDAVKVKHGEWEKGIHMVECSCCSEKFDFGDETWVEDFDICEDIGWKYCPNCGAKMRGEQE